MPTINTSGVIVLALSLALLSSLVSQVMIARVIVLLKLRYTTVWEEITSRPDSYRFNKRTISAGRVLRTVQRAVPSLSEDSELRRAMGVLRVAHMGVTVSFVVCLVAAFSHWLKVQL